MPESKDPCFCLMFIDTYLDKETLKKLNILFGTQFRRNKILWKNTYSKELTYKFNKNRLLNKEITISYVHDDVWCAD